MIETISATYSFKIVLFIIILRLSSQFYQHNWCNCIPLLDIPLLQIEGIAYSYSLQIDGPGIYDHNNRSSQRILFECLLLTLSNILLIVIILNELTLQFHFYK